MEIKQLQVGYNDAQDRMVLRINIDQDKFANLVLTRRVCRFMLDQIGPFLNIAEPENAKPVKRSRKKTPEQTASVVADPLKPVKSVDVSDPAPAAEAAAEKPDYKTPFEERAPEGNIFGKGSAWPVVVNAGCAQQDDKQVFTLQFENQQTMNLTLSEPLAKGLFRLMVDLAERIQWFGGISSPLPQGAGAVSDADTESAIKRSITYH